MQLVTVVRIYIPQSTLSSYLYAVIAIVQNKKKIIWNVDIFLCFQCLLLAGQAPVSGHMHLTTSLAAYDNHSRKLQAPVTDTFFASRWLLMKASTVYSIYNSDDIRNMLRSQDLCLLQILLCNYFGYFLTCTRVMPWGRGKTLKNKNNCIQVLSIVFFFEWKWLRIPS